MVSGSILYQIFTIYLCSVCRSVCYWANFERVPRRRRRMVLRNWTKFGTIKGAYIFFIVLRVSVYKVLLDSSCQYKLWIMSENKMLYSYSFLHYWPFSCHSLSGHVGSCVWHQRPVTTPLAAYLILQFVCVERCVSDSRIGSVAS